MIGVRVALSSGDSFYLDCGLEDGMESLRTAAEALKGDGLIEIGGRAVNPAQIAQLTIEQVPSIESPERLQEAPCNS